MKKYLFKRILFSIFSLIVVTGTVMLLVYSLMDRSLILIDDEGYKKRNGSDKIAYSYQRYEEFGYIYLEQFPSWLTTQKNLDPSSQEYKDAVAVVQNIDSERDIPDNPYCQEFAVTFNKAGYKVEWLQPFINSKGVRTTSGYLVATKDKNVFTRLGEYFGRFFSIETPWTVDDPNLTDRYFRWEWDPYSNMPALVGSGSTHRYLIYFDDKFPFVHQNLFHINLGRSKRYHIDTTEVLLSRTGDAYDTEKILPADIYSENPQKELSDLDFHTVTYSKTISDWDAETYGEGNHYINAQQQKDGFTRIGNSFIIGMIATIGAYLLGLPIGIWMARKKDKLPDKIGNLYIVFIIAVPSLAYIYMFAAIGMNLFNLPFKWQYAAVPILGFILPTISLMLPSVGGLMRWTRRFMIDQENADYVKFARSQGLTEKEIFRKHIFRNAMIFLVHGIPGAILGNLVGAIVTERVYNVPGIGGLLTEAINHYDNGVIVAATVFYTAISILALLLGDLLLAKYDPRVSFTNERG